jgi:hypothetical protein
LEGATMNDEPVQVREGVWMTRDGEHVEVRARDMTGNESSEWQWLGRRKNLLATWRNDGTLNASREQSTGDLVTYLRPLPEPEPATEVQPVQIREGVWRTRGGRQVEVRERSGADSYSFRWAGMLLQINESWRDDGRWSAKNETSHRDLVEYVGPLPKQTTTEQLAEIEAGMAEIEKDVAELVQQDKACSLQAELLLVTSERETLRADLTEVASERDALVREINEATADRDRLQRELADMTKHSAELLESAQQARDERDLLAQRLVTKPSEENLQKQVGRQQIEINTLKDQLQDMTADRDEQARLRETVDSTCRILGGEAKHWKNRAQEISDRMAVEITRAERAEAKARELQIELDAAGQQPAPADRSEQIERIWDESRERAVSEIIELVIPLQVATGTHAESVLQILPAVIRRWMDGGTDDAE